MIYKLLGAGLVACAFALPGTFAQQSAIIEIPPAMTLIPDLEIQSSAQQPSQETQKNQAAVETFTGSISKGVSGYFLKVSDVMFYKLDNESKVKDYEGKKVEVTGTLEPSTNLIHVQSIKLFSR
jgi:hypothetical protein